MLVPAGLVAITLLAGDGSPLPAPPAPSTFANPRVQAWAADILLPDCTPQAPGAAAATWLRWAQVPPDTAPGSALTRFIDAAVEVAARQGAPIVRCPPRPPRMGLRFAALLRRARADPSWGNLLARECAAIAAYAPPPPAAAGDGAAADALLQAEARWRCALAEAGLSGRYTAERRQQMQRARLAQAELPAPLQARVLRDADTRALRRLLGEPAAGRVLTPAAAARPPARH